MDKPLAALTFCAFLLSLMASWGIYQIYRDTADKEELYRKLPIHENTLQSVQYIEGGTPLKMILTPERKLTKSEIDGYPWKGIARLVWDQGSKRYDPAMPDMYATQEGFILVATSVSLKVTMGNPYLFIVTPTRSTNHHHVQYLFLRLITSEID